MGRSGTRVADVFLAVLVLLAAALLSYGCTSGDDASSEPTLTTSESTTPSGAGEQAREQRFSAGPGNTSESIPRPPSEEAQTNTLATEIRSIARSHPGTYGVTVWQPSSGQRVTLYAERSFEAASLAKLPVLLALYREAAAGRVDLSEKIRLRPADVAPGTGVLKDRPVGTTLTLRECAYYLVSESDNTAWAMIERRLGEPRVERELAHIGADSTHYEYGHHTTTPEDVLTMLEHISDPDYTTPALSQEMLSFMSGTAFEEGLPKGLPPEARVAHKIGILGESFHDAGVVYPAGGGEEGRYYLVVLSEETTRGSSLKAMRKISSAAYRSVVYPEAPPRSDRP